VCTHETENLSVVGSGKGAAGWFPLSAATVYFDHPVDAPAAHTLNIDFRNPERGPAARIAVELEAGSARELARAILAVLAAVPPELLDEQSSRLAVQPFHPPEGLAE
jgi:hypothetical protein